jgi:hypothetical protein
MDGCLRRAYSDCRPRVDVGELVGGKTQLGLQTDGDRQGVWLAVKKSRWIMGKRNS